MKISYKRRKINKLMMQINDLYLSEDYPSMCQSQYENCKYYLLYINTNQVYNAFNNQDDLIEELESLVKGVD